MDKTINIMNCFNDNYAIPGGVAILSLLENSSRDYFYNFFILHNDLSVNHQSTLEQIVKNFPNASIKFIDMKKKFCDLFDSLKTKGHFSAEMFYKFCVPELFPDLDKIMIADVDVVYLNDVAPIYEDFDVNGDYYVYAAKSILIKSNTCETKNKISLFFKILKKIRNKKKQNYLDLYTEEERSKLICGAGYYIFNLKKMREDNIYQKCVDFAYKNSYRLLQPEQDVISLICYPKIKIMPANALVCTYSYDMFKTKEDYNNALGHTKEEVDFALNNPIQLHYAGMEKPWNCPGCLKSEIWFNYLVKTPFLREYLDTQQKHIIKKETILKFKLPFAKRILSIEKEWQ